MSKLLSKIGFGLCLTAMFIMLTFIVPDDIETWKWVAIGSMFNFGITMYLVSGND